MSNNFYDDVDCFASEINETINFGNYKHDHLTAGDLVTRDPSYVVWLHDGDLQNPLNRAWVDTHITPEIVARARNLVRMRRA